ncbi:MAG TPA: MBL fold metallo-hydrolase, partial [Arenibacter sp.]|nr:MBL fold metallo-hydrolase [Arenibacter sp.]
EKAGNIKAKRQKLAEAMYDTIQHKFTELPDNAVVYPAHGAGSLCGKSLSEANSSTLGNERMGNWAFKKQTQDQFVEKLLDSQPFIPSYFGFNVDVNKSGAANLRTAIAAVPFMMNTSVDGLIIDVRNEIEFKKGSLKGSINIPATSEDSRFETWLGAIVEPNEKFSLVIDNPEDLDHILNRVAKIGYENHLQAVVTLPEGNLIKLPQIDINDFRNNPKKYTILDVRNESEVEEEKFFENALSHPLNELRKTANEIPTDKPIVVHCAGGYRSAVGSSILAKELKATQVFDLGEQINEFK